MPAVLARDPGVAVAAGPVPEARHVRGCHAVSDSWTGAEAPAIWTERESGRFMADGGSTGKPGSPDTPVATARAGMA